MEKYYDTFDNTRETRRDNDFDSSKRFRSEAPQRQGRLSRFFGLENEANEKRTAFESLENNTATGGTVIYSPTNYEDVELLIDHLKQREQVIVDFTNLNQTSVYRTLDFMSGAIYALGGSVQQITKNIFLFAPSGVTISIPSQKNGR